MDRVVVWTLVALVAGGVVGALVVAAPFSPAAPRGVVFVHVENSGSVDIAAHVELRQGGKVVVQSTFTAPAHSSVDKAVVRLMPGPYDVVGSFSNGGATASATVRLDTRDCATASLATFALDATNGMAMTSPASAGCRE